MKKIVTGKVYFNIKENCYHQVVAMNEVIISTFNMEKHYNDIYSRFKSGPFYFWDNFCTIADMRKKKLDKINGKFQI